MDKLTNCGFHLLGTDARLIDIVVFSMTGMFTLHLGEAWILSAESAVIKFAIRVAQDWDLRKVVALTESSGLSKSIASQVSTHYLAAEIHAVVDDSHLEEVQLI